jgi:cell division protein ZapA
MSDTVELRIAGQIYRVVSSAPAAELQRLASVVNQKLAEIPTSARGAGSQGLLLVAIALAHEAEAERERGESIKARVRALLERLLGRIDVALEPSESDPAASDAP